jgi:hypothetical protein
MVGTRVFSKQRCYERFAPLPARNFKELRDAVGAGRRDQVASRVRETIAAMPLEELRRARQMTQTRARFRKSNIGRTCT